MPNHRRQDRELDALYAQLPRLDCQGLCHDSCGPIDMSIRERARIEQRAGAVTCGAGATCSMLTPDRRCRVYDIRPMVCRLWGVVRGMRCPYGCVPEGGLLSDREGARLLLEAERLGGSPVDKRRLVRSIEQALEALETDEQLARRVEGFVRSGRATLEGRTSALRRSGLRSPFER